VKALVIGCGRVGSNVAKRLAKEGWDVSVVDEKEEALSRLGDDWRGGFVTGHGMDVVVLREAGIEDADAVVVETVLVRLLDPARAQFYAERGLHTVCPTIAAIDSLTNSVLASAQKVEV